MHPHPGIAGDVGEVAHGVEEHSDEELAICRRAHERQAAQSVDKSALQLKVAILGYGSLHHSSRDGRSCRQRLVCRLSDLKITCDGMFSV
jgi:hypothetical protein